MYQKIIAGVLAFVATLAVLVGLPVAQTSPTQQPVAVAHAGECTISAGNVLCGKIRVRENSPNGGVWVVKDWGNQSVGRHLYAGQVSTSYFKDADGLHVRPWHCVDVRQLVYGEWFDRFIRYCAGMTARALKLGDNLNEYSVWEYRNY